MSLLQAVEFFLRAAGVPPSKFGRDCVKDPRLVHDLRRGREPGSRMRSRVIAYLEEKKKILPEGDQRQLVYKIRLGEIS